ncbi:TauD/TfdA dioxygenase family protein [Nocardia salmonicida]|uniref:TauD/TfdA dioxygenase family protein n=1 Tax=Nocardia salmonicida TaxID=53431 RepID=UPI00147198BA|nr:TauD/TfdA family dioxygenase [Nocardia salmonicida]
MQEIAEQVTVSASNWRGEIQDRLKRFGIAIIEPIDTSEHSIQLEDVMLPLGSPVEYGFGTTLALEPQEGSDNLQFTTKGMRLHADSTFNSGPSVKYIGMQCEKAPEVGGETLVARSAAFFDNAPRDLLDTMRNIVIEYRNRIGGYYKDRAEGDHPRLAPIQVDPDTGEQKVVVGFTDPSDPMRTHDAAVVGYNTDESAALLCRIEETLHLPSVLYTHRWRVGEIVVLDNRRVLHGRAAFPNQPRKLIRLSVA